MKVLMLEPLTLASFRWTGDFTWIATGPSVEGASEPFPLPSTMLGILATLSQKRPSSSDEFVEECEVIKIIKEFLGDFEVLRGPYMLTRISGKHIVALHVYSRSLAIIEIDWGSRSVKLSIKGVRFVDRIGLGLSRSLKVSKPHMLYSQSLFDPNYIKSVLGLDPRIRVDIVSKNTVVSNEWIVKIGGENRVGIASITDDEGLMNVMERAWDIVVGSGSWSSIHGKVYTYVASPILLDQEDIMYKLASGSSVKLDNGLTIRVPKVREVIELAKALMGHEDVQHRYEKHENEEYAESLAKKLRVKMLLLGPGYDIVRNCPRPLHLAIAPGSILIVENASPREIYSKGAGLYSEAIWGTLVPIPYPVRNT